MVLFSIKFIDNFEIYKLNFQLINELCLHTE
jgi:hypothetical protein